MENCIWEDIFSGGRNTADGGDDGGRLIKRKAEMLALILSSCTHIILIYRDYYVSITVLCCISQNIILYMYVLC